MKTSCACLAIFLCLTVSTAATGPFWDLRLAVSGRIFDLGGSPYPTAAEVRELKALNKALDYIEGAERIAEQVAAPEVSEIPELLAAANYASKAAKELEKSATPDASVQSEANEIGNWLSGFLGWLVDRIEEVAPGLSPGDQVKVALALAKAEGMDTEAEATWWLGEWGASAKLYVKAIKSLAKLRDKYTD